MNSACKELKEVWCWKRNSQDGFWLKKGYTKVVHLSLLLYNIYLLDGIWCGSLMYADDIVLLVEQVLNCRKCWTVRKITVRHRSISDHFTNVTAQIIAWSVLLSDHICITMQRDRKPRPQTRQVPIVSLGKRPVVGRSRVSS